MSMLVDTLIPVIRVFVMIVALGIWSIVGVVCWIPFLTRMIAYFTAMVTASAFSRVDITDAQEKLDFAIQFYIYGFSKILEIPHTKYALGTKLKNVHKSDLLQRLKTLAVEVLYTIIFWAGIAKLVGLW